MASIFTESVAGSASYSTGGYVVSTGLSTLTDFKVEIGTAHANLGQVLFDVTLNSPGAGQATVKIMRQNHDRLTNIGAPSGLPSGVTAPSTSGQTYDTVAHTHAIDHDHPVTAASTTPTGQSARVFSNVVLPATTTHTHTLNLPNFTGSAVNESTHSHTWDNIYEHQHTLTNTTTDLAATELANGTDISGATLNHFGTDA